MSPPRRATESRSTAENFLTMRSDYAAAKSSHHRRRRTGVAPMGSSADYHFRNEMGYYAMVELARDLFRNNALIGQGVRRLVSNVVQGGFTMDPQTGNTDADSALAARWLVWTSAPDQCDRAGELTFHGLEKLALQTCVVDGDILALPLQSGQLEMVEGHRLRTPSNARRSKQNVVLGVHIDDARRRLEYWIAKEDIAPNRQIKLVGDIKKYPARDREGNRQVFHLYDPDRVSQTRGVSAFAPIVDTADMGDDLMFAQLVKARVASCYAILHQFREGFEGGAPVQHGEKKTEPRPDGTTRTIEGIAPGMEIFSYPDEELKGFSPNVPNSEFFAHIELILRIVAVNLDLPLAVFLLDPSNTNFSGWRGAMDQARLRFREIQRWLIDFFHGPVYRWKVRQWQADDRVLRVLGDDALKHRFNPPGWAYIEPLKDRSAELLAVRNALTSQRRRCAERGTDWDDLSTEIVDDNALMITKAHAKASDLNQENPGLDVTWREVACLPTPDGVNISVVDESANVVGESGNKNKKESTDEP